MGHFGSSGSMVHTQSELFIKHVILVDPFMIYTCLKLPVYSWPELASFRLGSEHFAGRV